MSSNTFLWCISFCPIISFSEQICVIFCLKDPCRLSHFLKWNVSPLLSIDPQIHILRKRRDSYITVYHITIPLNSLVKISLTILQGLGVVRTCRIWISDLLLRHHIKSKPLYSDDPLYDK